jgi:hypothetical protein
MAQADLNIANQSGSAFRADLNNQLLALGTLMSGATEPSTTYAYMLWADTTASLLKMRNAANNGWIVLRGLEGKLAVGTTIGANVNLRINRDITGGATAWGQYIDSTVQTDVTTSGIGVSTLLGTAASTTVTSLVHFQAATGTLGAGTSITNQIGFSASSSIAGATNDYGFFGNIAAGSGNWNCFMGGTAPNYFAGQVQLGAGSAGTPSLSTNGDTDSGVFFPAANGLGLVVGGAEAAGIRTVGSTPVVNLNGARSAFAFPMPGSGNVRVAAGSAGGIALSTFDTADYTAIQFVREVASVATQVGTVTCTSTATAYNTSSDYRLKENVVPLTGATERLGDLKVYQFNFTVEPGKVVDGFLAHEAQDVVPEAVTGEKDEVDDDGNPIYQGIDQSKLVPLLTAALQETVAELAALKDRVAALEA